MGNMGFWKQGLVVVALAGQAYALDPSTVFTAVNSQGRPLVGASVNVTDSVGASVDAYTSSAGTTLLTQVPASGLVQFYQDPGTYNVTVSGSGETRAFVVVIPASSITGAVTDADFPSNYDSLMRRTAASGVYGQIRINMVALIAPTVNDDVTFNYTVGSTWVDTVLDNAYVCTDATDGAAVWRQVGTANIVDGNATNDVPYWDGSTWTPTSWLQADATHAAVGDTGFLISASTFQIGQINASTTFDIYSQVAAVVQNTVIGQIRFGSTDSSSVPREAAFIKARAMDTWPIGDTSAATSLDFLVQANDGSTIGMKALRVQPQLVIVGESIADNSLQGQARLVTQGVSVTDTTGMVSSVFLTPTGLDVTVKSYTLPDDSGTAGYYMRTDGNSLFPTLSWEAIAAAPGNFAVTGQTTTTAAFSLPSYSFIGDTNTGFGSSAGSPCIIDEAISALCVTGSAADTFTSIAGGMYIATGVTTNDSLNIIAIGGSGNEIEVNSNEFLVNGGEVTFSGISGDTDGRALCKKADDNIGTCSDVPNGSGVCTCT